MGFLHTVFKAYDIPHGNLKSSNILLDDDHEPLLNDYAFQPLVNPNHASEAMFAYKSPEFSKNNQQVSHKSDVYCLGIIILEVLTGKLPSQYLNNENGGTDVVALVLKAVVEGKDKGLLDPLIVNSLNSVEEMLKLLKIGAACVESDLEQRLGMEEAIRKIEEVSL